MPPAALAAAGGGGVGVAVAAGGPPANPGGVVGAAGGAGQVRAGRFLPARDAGAPRLVHRGVLVAGRLVHRRRRGRRWRRWRRWWWWWGPGRVHGGGAGRDVRDTLPVGHRGGLGRRRPVG